MEILEISFDSIEHCICALSTMLDYWISNKLKDGTFLSNGICAKLSTVQCEGSHSSVRITQNTFFTMKNWVVGSNG